MTMAYVDEGNWTGIPGENDLIQNREQYTQLVGQILENIVRQVPRDLGFHTEPHKLRANGADVVLNGDSFLAGFLGQKIADTHVSVVDDPSFDKTGMKFYDHEGTKGREVRIIDHGIHNELMHNRRTASLLREKPSGNAYSDNIYNSALVRMRSIFVEPGDFAKEEILEETQNGIYIGSSIGGAVNSRTGMFNIQVQYAREIKDGELGTWYKASNINGSTLITLQKIGAIGKELMQQPAPCSKDKQNMILAAISPHVQVNDLQVGLNG